MTEPAPPENRGAAGDPIPDADRIEAPAARRKLSDWRWLLGQLTCVLRWGVANFVIVWDTLVLRAWIAVLVTAILAALFLWADQTPDLLLGIMFDIDLGQFHVLSGEQLQAGVRRYAAFWIASVSLVAVLGLTVRITGVPRDQLSGSGQDPKMLEPVRLCAWVIVVLATIIMHSAALQTLRRAPGEPLLVSIVVLVCCGIRWAPGKEFRGKSVLLWSSGIVAAAFCASMLFTEGMNERWSLTFFVRWAEWATITAIVLAALFAGAKQTVAWPRALLGLLWVLLALIVYAGPVELPQQIGSLATALSHIAFITASAAALICVARRWIFAGRRSDIAVVLAVIAAIWWSGSSEKIGQEQLAGQPGAAPAVKQESDTKTLAYAIHADGGGLRAALFTATILSLADDLTCGRFGTHVFAASGVSGGALGIATWAMLRQELVSAQKSEASAWSECKAADVPALVKRLSLPQPRQQLNIPSPLTKLVYGTLVRDHLAAPLAAMLTPELPFSRNAHRGQALVDSWQASALQAIRKELADRSSPEGYTINLGRLDAGLKVRPKLIFTATDADSGDRVVMSNIDWEGYAAFKNMQLGVAALNSARFPIISPPGVIRTPIGWRRVVDGGFYDNSGAASLRQILIDASTYANEPLPQHLKTLRNDSPPEVMRPPIGWTLVVDRAFYDNSRAASLREILIAASAHTPEPMPAHLRTLRIDGNPSDGLDTTCETFADVLLKKHYTPVRSIWKYGPAPLRSTKDGVPTADSVPSFNGLSSLSAFWNARSARSREAVQSLKSTELRGIVETELHPFSENPLAEFDSVCVDQLPDEAVANDSERQCVAHNQAMCLAAANAHFGPLGWYLSNAAALDIMNWASHVLAESPFLREQL
ncbi:hypothetical protein [Bradyrhizobium sp. LTSP849]|uniref:hypothetical protein n=1 Tax=Bradyrhizobium sp. LTSP849 TaxID=1615890 RepID=UPI000A74D128|nr:hypothetical protein [Bradyrhizobium sp. LTSP849]